MRFSQCKFISYNGNTAAELGGIAVYKYDHLIGVICGCCGNWIPEKNCEILEEYDFWVPFGEALVDFHDSAEEWDDEEE
jgi:hypothetical protein